MRVSMLQHVTTQVSKPDGPKLKSRTSLFASTCCLCMILHVHYYCPCFISCSTVHRGQSHLESMHVHEFSFGFLFGAFSS